MCDGRDVPDGIADVVRARRFELVDSRGSARISLALLPVDEAGEGVDEATIIKLESSTGEHSFTAVIDEFPTWLGVLSGDNTRAVLHSSSHDVSFEPPDAKGPRSRAEDEVGISDDLSRGLDVGDAAREETEALNPETPDALSGPSPRLTPPACGKCHTRHRWWPHIPVDSVLVEGELHFNPVNDPELLLCGKRLA